MLHLMNQIINQECEITPFQVGWLKAKDQTILALHHRVITHNERFGVDHDDNRYELKVNKIQKKFQFLHIMDRISNLNWTLGY